jgi:Rrf2 family transcriptional regulator, cysteine metabolism repressor
VLKLSSRVSYGVRALVDMAQRAKTEPAAGKNRPFTGIRAPVTLAAIASRQGMPQPFLEQIFSRLRKAGLVEALRGARGGYRLRRAPSEISVGDVVAALEGPLGPALCILPENYSPDCREVEGCLSRTFCKKLENRISGVLESTSIADLAREGEPPARSRKAARPSQPALVS